MTAHKNSLGMWFVVNKPTQQKGKDDHIFFFVSLTPLYEEKIWTICEVGKPFESKQVATPMYSKIKRKKEILKGFRKSD